MWVKKRVGIKNPKNNKGFADDYLGDKMKL